MNKMFRLLRADEIEVRISQIAESGVMLLLYKDARCDQSILDETVGPMNWQRHHNRENKNCIVSIYDEKKKYWVEKEDTGTESNTEAEKGLASDSFKRACFNWGIGRELYSAPTMWFPKDQCNIRKRKRTDGKDIETCYDTLKVSEIEYDDAGNITYVRVENKSTGNVKSWGTKSAPAQSEEEQKPVVAEKKQKKKEQENKYVLLLNKLIKKCNGDGIPPEAVANVLHKDNINELTQNQLEFCDNDNNWNKVKEAVGKMLGGTQ